jgi:hypothetical protein
MTMAAVAVATPLVVPAIFASRDEQQGVPLSDAAAC